MLSQGLVSTLAGTQVRQAATLQLGALQLEDPAASSLGSKVLASSFEGSSNLRTDPALSRQLIEEQLTKQGIPTIEVSRGDLITRKGEPITPQAYDVLDHFGKVRREPQPLVWLARFWKASRAVPCCCSSCDGSVQDWKSVMPFWPSALLLLVQGLKIWFGATISPLAVLVPTLALTEGLGTGCGLIWLAVASMIWPVPVNGLNDGRLLVAAGIAAIGALVAGRQRSRGQLLQMTLLLPVGALLLQWLLLVFQP